MSEDDTLVPINTRQEFERLVGMLRHHHLLRTFKVVSSITVNASGKREEYDAQLVLQSDNLAEQPLELVARGVTRLEIQPHGMIQTTDRGRFAPSRCELVWSGLKLRCRELGYRLFDGGRVARPDESGAIH